MAICCERNAHEDIGCEAAIPSGAGDHEASNRDDLILAYLPLALGVARRLCRGKRDDDASAIAALAVVRCVDRRMAGLTECIRNFDAYLTSAVGCAVDRHLQREREHSRRLTHLFDDVAAVRRADVWGFVASLTGDEARIVSALVEDRCKWRNLARDFGVSEAGLLDLIESIQDKWEDWDS